MGKTTFVSTDFEELVGSANVDVSFKLAISLHVSVQLSPCYTALG